MALYIGNEKIGELYIGGDKIKQAYIGSELVYSSSHYTPDQVLYESSTGGASTTLNLLDDGKYQVICIAGGGGGSYATVSGRGLAAGGGSGSGFNCVFQLTAGNYVIAIGSGGASKKSGAASGGGNSRFGTCYAYGGGGGDATKKKGGAGGSAPALTYTRTTTTLNTAGNAGNIHFNSTSGGAAVYSSYGKGGDASKTPSAGNAGYVKVVYKGA